ncbi:ATP-binding protein [Vibrio cyclitrophicus]|uniref:ATP-binding protein n=1 Tax=Vibrio cyclitrophicus TaxID=47951 RepID=UPI0011B50895|nr:AAA family ATPase [Vibrio cyclitrophicus]CAK3406783.1 ATPase [Vibrio crassostreae]CAK3850354.1 ATPase [Vibrio crassostreae]
MNRKLLQKLLIWKNKTARKPLLIEGARQTGKTFLLRELLGREFKKVLRVDFLQSPELMEAFSGSLNPDMIITNIELLTGDSFNIDTDLLILDEIGECPRAVTSLKYFAEKKPEAYITSCGSTLGLLTSFPVGKVEQHSLRPLSFREFIWASGEKTLQNAFEQQLNSPVAHTKLLELLNDYYYVGGMPEAVNTWFENSETSILQRIEAVSEVHRRLIEDYMHVFRQHSGSVDARLLESVFRSIPAQLSSVHDKSVKRFKFKGVHDRKSRYAEYESAITWLQKCQLVLKNYPIEGQPKTPLVAHKKESTFKLFLLDVGLLNHLLDTSYLEIKRQGHEYKGYIAESFVHQELASLGIEPTFSWSDARAEMELIISDERGRIVPVEIKSSNRTRAKSLPSYITKCSPHKTIKLTGTQGSPTTEVLNIEMPLYYTEFLLTHLRSMED